MAKGQSAPDVRALEDSYKIVGELRGSEGTRKYMAVRIEDGAEVIISVLTAPRGAESNELSHFAADVQLLASLDHPNMARVFESRWIGAGGKTLAVVSERVQGTTLAEALDSGEGFSNPRAAAVLQEVWGVLDWARASGVVHRGVTPDNVYLKPGSDRVTVVFGPTMIPVEGVNDVSGDARTVGALAWAMLTGKEYGADGETKRLAELAPNLAIRVVDATETMVHGASDRDDEIDVPTFVGIIAAGDVLKQAEVEISAMKEDYQEEHRIALASCENQRTETERWANEQAELLSNERDEFERTMTQHHEQLIAARDELHERTASLERWIGEFEARRGEVTRMRAEQVEGMAEARRTREAADAEARTRRENPAERESHRDRNENIRSIVGAPPKGAALPPKPAPSRASREPAGSGGSGGPGSFSRRWAVPAAVVAVLLVIAGVIGGIVYRQHVNAPASRVAAARPVAPPPGAAGNPPQSAAGTVVPPAPIVTPAAPAQDSAAPAQQTPVNRPVDTPRPSAPRPRPENRPANDANGVIPQPVVTPPRDSAAGKDSIWTRTDSVVAHDSTHRDSTVRPDSAGYLRDTNRLDSTRRDSARRDSAAKPGSSVRVDTTYIRGTPTTRPDSVVRVPP